MHTPVNKSRGRLIALLVLPVVLAAAPGAARGQELRDLVEEALDQNVKQIEINDLPIGEALDQLAERTGLRFALSEAAIEQMPYGARTRISIVLQDLPLRRGLAQLLDGLGLAMQVADDRVQIDAAPVLNRLGRRIAISEVAVLGKLATKHWAELDRDAVPLQFQIDPERRPEEAFAKALAQTRAANALRAFEAAAEALGWVWVPQNETIVFMTRQTDVARRLDRPIDVTYSRMRLDDVLVDLGRRVGVTMLFEPGALQAVQAAERPVDLMQRETTVRQTLELICGNTGLSYEITNEGVRIRGPQKGGQARPVSSATRLIRFTIPLGLDEGQVDLIVAYDELPLEVQRLCEEKLRAFLQELPEQLKQRER